MEYQIQCLKKVIAYLIKNDKKYGKLIDVNSSYILDEPINLDDSIIVLLSMFLNTGYLLDNKLSAVDWRFKRNEFTLGLFKLNDRDIFNKAGLKEEDFDVFIPTESELKLIEEIKKELGINLTDMYTYISDEQFNNFMQSVRNGTAHYSIKYNLNSVSFMVEDPNDHNIINNYDFEYCALFYLLSELVKKLLSETKYLDINMIPNDIKLRATYKETKEYYLDAFKDSILYDNVLKIINEVDNLQYEDQVIHEVNNYLYKLKLISKKAHDRIKNSKGKIQEFDSELLNWEIESRIDVLCNMFYYYADAKSIKDIKIGEYFNIFDIIYRSYYNTHNNYDRCSEIEEDIDLIDEDFKIIRENARQCFNNDKMNGYYSLLFTIIFGMLPWDDIDVNDIDLSIVNIDSEFRINKENLFNNNLFSFIKEYYNLLAKEQEINSNSRIPNDVKTTLLNKNKTKQIDSINKIYNEKCLKDQAFDNSAIIRHLRNTFCHGYYYIKDDIVYFEDYDSKQTLTFKAKVKLEDLFMLVINNEFLNKLIHDDTKKRMIK